MKAKIKLYGIWNIEYGTWLSDESERIFCFLSKAVANIQADYAFLYDRRTSERSFFEVRELDTVEIEIEQDPPRGHEA